jgi:hypothetical protein
MHVMPAISRGIFADPPRLFAVVATIAVGGEWMFGKVVVGIGT